MHAQDAQPDPNFLKAIEFVKKGNYSAAIPLFDLAIKSNPNQNFLYYHRGNAKFLAENYSSAKQDFSKSISIEGTFEAYVKLGLIYLQEQSLDLASSQMKSAFSLRPQDPQVNFYLGLINNRMENYVDAMVYWDNYMASKPRQSEAYYGRGEALFQIGEVDKAIDDFKMAIYFDATNIYAHEWLAKAYKEKSDLENSIKHYTMCVELSQENNDFLLRRAELYQLAGKIEKACEDLERAGGLDMNTAFAKCDS
jgi:tetratricopeptide (TPR) repeat protein